MQDNQQQRYYPQYGAYQKVQATPAPKQHSRKWKVIGVIIVLLIVAGGIVMLLKQDESEFGIVMLLRQQEPEFEIVVSKFIQDNVKFEERSDTFYVDEDVLLYTQVKHFNVIPEDGMYNYVLYYGELVLDPQGDIMQSISDPEMFKIDDLIEGPISEYYFTTRISALNFEPGTYTIVSKVTDKLTGISAFAEKKFEIVYPETVRLSGPYIAGDDGSVPQYPLDIVIPMFVQGRGFTVDGMNADLDVILEVYDNQGILQLDYCNYNLMYINKVPGNDVFNVQLNMDTAGLLPGIYWVELTATDYLADQKHSVVKPIMVGNV